MKRKSLMKQLKVKNHFAPKEIENIRDSIKLYRPSLNSNNIKVFTRDELLKIDKIKRMTMKKVSGRIRHSYKVKKSWEIDDSEISQI